LSRNLLPDIADRSNRDARDYHFDAAVLLPPGVVRCE